MGKKLNKIDLLVLKSKDGDFKAKEELLNSLKPLILSSIKKYYFGNMDFEDLVQEGYLRILNELERFDTSRGVPFLGYIKIQIRFLYLELRRIRSEALTLNLETSEGEEILDLQEDETQDIEREVIENESRILLKSALDNVTAKQKMILQKIYLDEISMKKLSREMGVHYQTVINLKKRGVLSLRKALGDS